MSKTVNAIINNLSERLGEVADAVGPIIEKVGDISQTVVRETANSGFVYTMIGVSLLCLSVICFVVLLFFISKITHKCDRDIVSSLMYVGTIAFSLVGFILITANMCNWIAPTKAVMREIIRNIQ